MSDEETNESINADEQRLEGDINKEISKLTYFLEETDQLIQAKDYAEIEVTNDRAGKIIIKLSDLISQTEELKIDNGTTPRSVRQWKKDVKSRYLALVEDNEKLARELKGKQERLDRETDKQHLELKERQYEQEERRRIELRERQEEYERQLWHEKLEAELLMTQKKLDMEKAARSTAAKLPKLKITPFKGTSTDWVRFENMFLTLVHEKPTSAEEKFGYLLEMVSQKVREKIANLKPGEIGYKIAWERLKKEYGHPKLVINAHMDAIINLTPVKGSNYDKVQEFYEKLSKNFDALQTLGEGDKLSGFVMTTINKMPQVKPDLVRSDDDWEEWSMDVLITNLQKWLRRNKVDDVSKNNKNSEGNWFQKGSGAQKSHCVFCGNSEHWSDKCKTVKRLEDRKKFFAEKNLCFNCGRTGHRGNQCRSRGCLKCHAKHHTSLCDKSEVDNSNQNPTSLTGFTTFTDEKSLPAIIPVSIRGQTLWAYLDTGSGRNFISRDAAKRLKLNPTHHESREIVTVNGTSTQSMPVFQTIINSLDGKAHEEIELTGSRLQDFTTVQRPDMNELKKKYTHTQDRRFYMIAKGEYPIHLILGDGTYSRIRTEKVYKGNPGDPIVEETTFGWVIHGGDDYSSDNACMFSREVNDYEQQPLELEDTVTALKENTYVDNIMQTGSEIDDLKKFKRESDVILASANFPIHKWESNIESLEDKDMPNPSKILGHIWDKREDTLEIQVPAAPEDEPVTKRSILSQLGRVYDPLGIISPTMAEGKHIYREACEEKKGWNAEVSPNLRKQWLKWNRQLKNIKVPRTITGKSSKMKAIDLHVFADASNLACSATTIAVVEHTSGTVKGLLTSKSRISKRNTSIARLELVGAHMAANMVKNLHNALHRLPIKSTVVWLDSMVALYWVTNPGKPWKVFISNRVKKIAENTSELGIVWKYCPSHKNLADLGSRGATVEKMEKGEWFSGPDWLLEKKRWPEQPNLKVTTAVNQESKPIKEEALFTKDRKPDEWDAVLERSTYWRVLRVTAWALRFLNNCLAKHRQGRKKSGPLGKEEITTARNNWVRRVQSNINPELQAPGWRIVEDKDTKALKCKGRIEGYAPIYLEGGLFVEKLIAHTHNQIKHFGIANTMAALREHWWIPQLRTKVKKMIKKCNVCKLYSTKPYGSPLTSNMPTFRTEASKPFEVTGVDFAGPLRYKINKKEEGKCYVLIFTCASSRAVHLELTKSQEAEEFQRKLNAFIARRGRPRLMISDNAATFKATANWIKVVRKSEKLQDFLATQDIHWRFNLARSPWWGGIYERLIREIKKTLYKTLGRSHLYFESLEMVIMDIECNMNNRPLTYVESESGEEQVLTPNVLMRGENAYLIDDIESDEDELTKMQKRLVKTKDNAWKRWQREYVHSLMESQRVNGKAAKAPEVGEVVLVVGDEKNRGEWKKGKVLRQVQGKDGVVRGVVLLHKGHTIERPLQLVCPLEIRCTTQVQQRKTEPNKPVEEKKERRQAAIDARKRIRALAEIQDED